MRMLMLFALCAAQDEKPKQEPKPEEKLAPKFLYDPFKAWDTFGIGSSVVFEMEVSGNKMTITKTFDRKEDDVIHLKTLTAMAMLPDPLESKEEVKKVEAGKVPDADCPLCGKAYKDHKDESRWSEKKLKVGEKELTCQVWEPAEKTCDGKESPKIEIWYSKSVPGHLVVMKMPAMTMTCTKFEDKTVREGMKK